MALGWSSVDHRAPPQAPSPTSALESASPCRGWLPDHFSRGFVLPKRWGSPFLPFAQRNASKAAKDHLRMRAQGVRGLLIFAPLAVDAAPRCEEHLQTIF